MTFREEVMFKSLNKVSLTVLAALMTVSVYASNQKTICGEDDRVPSDLPKIGRLLGSLSDTGGCTLTMISRTCAITAGHCSGTFGIAEFNTPASVGGRIQHPAEEDIYPVDKKNTVYEYNGIGDDWAVVRTLPNSITGKYAGDVQGFYQVAFEKPQNGDIVRITGYGLDQSDPDRNLAQQTHVGEVTSVRGSSMYHVADTMGGNSGSSIIRESDEKIIGIHTNGGCYARGGSNAATAISENAKLVSAINDCLAEEALLQ